MDNDITKLLVSDQFKEMVLTEAQYLRDNLTEEEKNQLDKELVDCNSQKHCIYGLATGHCNSDRAYELMQGGCEIVMTEDHAINGKLPTKRRVTFDFHFYSPVETYIINFLKVVDTRFYPNYNSFRVDYLIDFILGKTDELPWDNDKISSLAKEDNT